ncbi:NAD-dependent epimerase/dehydratase family protein [Microcoleus sp. herbarium12]|uniref:NAD-dependent epimerase/dehydratase family protein n=1 Tax=Microcoleus sp. herbarium12 TaxID=3055437 RepID=UPI002FD6B89F
MLKNQNLIVIGKNSYIGGYFTKYASDNNNIISLSSKDCNFLDSEKVDNLFRNLSNDRPYTIVCLAGISRLVANSFDSYNENVKIVNNLIKHCKLTNIQSIIYFSSVDVYGSKPSLPIAEQSKIEPDTWYGLAKYSCEWMLISSGEVKCPVTILRIPGIYGHAPNDRSAIAKIASSIKNEQRVYIKGSGQNLRDYVYLEDICNLLALLIPLQYHGTINVATGQSHAIIDIANLIAKIFHIELEVIYQPPEAEREFDLMFDTQKLTSLVPNFRFTPLEEGIRSYFQESSQHSTGESK